MSRQRLISVLYICHFAALFCVSAQFHGSNENDNSIRLLPAYTIASRAGLLNSTTCGKELRDFKNAVDQRILWGLKTLDSSGGPRSGFFYGNNFWLGSRSQCLDIMNRSPFEIAKRLISNNTRYRDPRNEYPPFEVNYFVAHLKHNSTLQYQIGLPNEDLITLGLCLPASCSVNDLSFILERIFRDRIFLVNDLYSMDLSLIRVKDLKDDHQWLLNGRMLFICVVLMLTFIMMISGTIYDIFVYQKYLKAKNKNAVCVKNAIRQMEMTDSSSPREKNRIRDILMCFSAYTNTKMIFCTELDTEAIPIIHGLRFLSMIWIIIAHTVFYTGEYFDNKIWILRFGEGIPVQVISNATISVDTYFFLSGLLLTYVYLKPKTDQEQNKSINWREKLNEFFSGVIRRFLRLTPPYMMMIGILQLNSAYYDKTSQFYVEERQHEICPKYWWRNLLYINNLFGHKEMCMSWSWYLASDMQFFIIGLALLILSTVFFYTAVALLGTLLIGSIILNGYTSYVHEYIPTLDEQYRLLDVLYYPPWLRIGPYIIGMITGYIIIKLNKKIVLKKSTLILCWSVGSACNILVLFGLSYKQQISVLSTAIYVALSRTVWAIGIAWIVIVCCTKHGGIIKEILTSKIWIPLSRLTYCAYLLNPFIINSIRLHNETAAHLEFLSTSAMVLGHFGSTFFCAYALSLMAESPYILLMRTFIQSRSRKKYQRREIIISHM